MIGFPEPCNMHTIYEINFIGRKSFESIDKLENFILKIKWMKDRITFSVLNRYLFIICMNNMREARLEASYYVYLQCHSYALRWNWNINVYFYLSPKKKEEKVGAK